MTNCSLLRRSLALATLLVLTACGGGQDNSATQAPAEAPPAAAETPAPAPAPEAAPATTQAAAPQAAGVQESTTEPTDGGEQLKLASAATPADEPKWRFKEGVDYKVLTAAQGTTGSPDKIEVAEAFWYGCPHCYQFDPLITDYASKLPSDVRFVRLPVMWNPTNQIHARIYYTAQALGKADEMHAAIFREIHLEKKMLTDEKDIQEFFGRFGVSADDFQKTFRSFAVEGQLTRAKELTERYQIRSVPIIIVNGKYSTDAPGIKSHEQMLEVVTELIERERRR